jgi:hypothetical protein|tara:strand:- start:1377 stop:1682 length:306 start_codon:yes stop_codon:yes gene_type:complete
MKTYTEYIIECETRELDVMFSKLSDAIYTNSYRVERDIRSELEDKLQPTDFAVISDLIYVYQNWYDAYESDAIVAPIALSYFSAELKRCQAEIVNLVTANY